MFDNLPLDHRLRLALDALALAAPTAVQARVVPAALEGGDLLVSARTGSGKTLAYLIPTLQRILTGDCRQQPGTLALVLVPTRELARQVLAQCRALLAKSNLSAQAITGGADFKYQASLLRREPEVLVATPGRLREHCERGSAELGALQTLVLDEADRMLELGLREDVLYIASRCHPGRQVILLSATLHHRGIAAMAGSLLRSPEHIAMDPSRTVHADIGHDIILADHEAHKDRLLEALLSAGGYRRALVFARRRVTAARLAGLLARGGLRADCLHGDMSTEGRVRVMQRFRDAGVDILCASDIAARGLDVPGVDLVINYDMPGSGDDYLHRTGRSARAGASGLAVSFVTPGEWNLMIGIQRYLDLAFRQRTLPGLKAKYRGPGRRKSSGKAAGRKRAPGASRSGKTRSGERRPTRPRRGDTGAGQGGNDGTAPLSRKKPVA